VSAALKAAAVLTSTGYKLDRERREGRIERPPAFKRPALRRQDATLVPAELMPTSPVVKRAKRD